MNRRTGAHTRRGRKPRASASPSGEMAIGPKALVVEDVMAGEAVRQCAYWKPGEREAGMRPKRLKNHGYQQIEAESCRKVVVVRCS